MGVVGHSNYLVWFETARILMLDQIGVYSEIEAMALPTCPHCHAEYKSPARFDVHLEIHLFLKKKPAHVCILIMKFGGDELLATGHSGSWLHGSAVRPTPT